MPVIATPSLRPRVALGTVLVLGVMLLQVALDVVSGHENARIIARILFMALEMPVLILALGAIFSWSVKRRVGAARGLASSVAMATLVGAVFGLLYGGAALRIPELRLHSPNGAN